MSIVQVNRKRHSVRDDAGFEPVRTSRVVSGRVVRWWEGLMWLAWPYRVWRSAGDLLARKPQCLAGWLHRKFERLLRGQDDERACLFIVAEKPVRAVSTDEGEETSWEREPRVGDGNQAFDVIPVCRESG